MPKTVTTRLPDKYVADLEIIEKIEQLDTSAVMRRLLAAAIREWKKEYAVERYKKGEFSFGQVAEFAEVSVWDVPILLKDRQVPMNYNEKEFKEELKSVEWLLKKKKR